MYVYVCVHPFMCLHASALQYRSSMAAPDAFGLCAGHVAPVTSANAHPFIDGSVNYCKSLMFSCKSTWTRLISDAVSWFAVTFA